MRVDGLSTNRQYRDPMRRVLLTIFLVFAIGASGVANATAAQACPMQNPAAMDHDCCCDEDGSPTGNDSGKMPGCVVGMICSTVTAVPPSLTYVSAPQMSISAAYIDFGQQRRLSDPLRQFFRPPRTI
jgi:hypothetical protein